MANFFDTLKNVLEQDKRFFSEDGQLLRNAVYEAAMKMDADLLHLLLSNTETKARFFKEVDGILVFDKIGFSWVINNREFLPDSYTRFKNKIGLVNDKGELLSTKHDVELIFPYKDCILNGGQMKESESRNEIFYNELLSLDEIDRLLAPKVLINAKKYKAIESDKKGYHVESSKVTNFNFANDNLIIKGNNLLALASLSKRFKNTISCIFIDPPYYFFKSKPTDTFSYNSNFKLSSWLVFLKNRLEISSKLLKDEGCIFVTISDDGAHYLKVLMDSIFGIENFIADVTWESRKSVSSDGLMSLNSNHVLVYAKKKSSISKNNFRLALDIESFDKKDEKGVFKVEPFDAPGIRTNLTYKIVNPNTGEIYLPPQGRHWRTEEDNYKKLLKEGKIQFGEKGTSKPQLKSYYADVVKMSKGKATSTIWHDNSNSIIWANLDTNTNATKDQYALFGNYVFTNPKPESLVKRAIELSSSEGDYVLDFFMGSATTQAAAMKMSRHFIGIEQMDYIDNVSIERLKKVMEGEQTGISKEENWQGGGSFIYCELAKLNQIIVDEIETATCETALSSIYRKMVKSGFISYKVNPADIDIAIDDYSALSLENKKRFLMEILDKNLLYVNFCDIDDEEFGIPEEDKAFTRSFYGED